MDRKQLISTVESLNPDLKYTRENILEMVEQLDELTVIDMPILLSSFMIDDNTLFDITDIERILSEHTGYLINDQVLDSIMYRFEKIMDNKVSKDKLISVLVTIGKSKSFIEYSFLKSDFRSLKGDQLFINNETERIRLFSNEELISLRLQLS